MPGIPTLEEVNAARPAGAPPMTQEQYERKLAELMGPAPSAPAGPGGLGSQVGRGIKYGGADAVRFLSDFLDSIARQRAAPPGPPMSPVFGPAAEGVLPPNVPPQTGPEALTRGATSGAILGLLTGGTGIAGGLAGNAAAEYAGFRGAPPWLQILLGIGAGGVAGRPKVNPRVEAGRALADMDVPTSQATRNAMARRLGEGIQEAAGPGGPPVAQIVTEGKAAARTAKNAAWAGVRPELRNGVPVTGLKQSVGRLIAENADDAPEVIPRAAKKLLDRLPDDTASIDRLERLRTVLGQEADAAARSGKMAVARNAGLARQWIDEAIDGFTPPPGTPADVAQQLKNARRATQEYYKQFDPALGVVREAEGGRAGRTLAPVEQSTVIEGLQDSQRAVRAAITNEHEAANLVAIARKQGQQAVDGVRSAAVQYVLNGEVNLQQGGIPLDFSAAAAYKTARANPSSLRVLLGGRENYRWFVRLLDTARRLEMAPTGIPAAKVPLASLRVQGGAGGMKSAGVQFLRSWGATQLDRMVPSRAAKMKLLLAAAGDRQLTMDLLREPSVAERPAWQARMTGALVRAGIRAGATLEDLGGEQR